MHRKVFMGIAAVVLLASISCIEVRRVTSGSSNSGQASSGGAVTEESVALTGLYKKYTHANYRAASEFQKQVTASTVDYRVLNAAIFFMTNEIRIKKGRKAIPYREKLEVAAYFHSKSMATQNFFDHTNPRDRRRRSTSDRAKLAGIANPYIAENIVYTYTRSATPTYIEIAEEMLDSWMNSSGHKQNILSDKALSMGCGGYAKGKYWYGTQVFQWYEQVKSTPAAPVDRF